MRVSFDPASVAGSILKSAVTMAATAALGPVGGVAAAAGADVLLKDDVTKALSDAAGNALKVSPGESDLGQRVYQAVHDSMDSALDTVVFDEDNPCVILGSVRRALHESMDDPEAIVSVTGGDGRRILQDIVASVCDNDSDADIGIDVRGRIVEAFFAALVQKMQNDSLMSSALIYRTLGQGFGALYQQMSGMKVRLDSMEGILRSISEATSGQGELMRLLRDLVMRSDEGVSVNNTNFDPEAFREELRSALREIAYTRTSNSGQRLPLMLTSRPLVRKFVGRTEELEKVEELLECNQVVSIRADGGVGKTALAARLMETLVKRSNDGSCPYRHLAWVRYTGDLRGDLSVIDVPGVESSSNEKRVDKVLQWLFNTDEMTLLVIDNVDEYPGDDAEDIFTRFSSSVRVLITARAALDFDEEHQLAPMEASQALQVFYAYYLDTRATTLIGGIEARTDYQVAREIVERAKGNALLIELIAHAARSDGDALDTY